MKKNSNSHVFSAKSGYFHAFLFLVTGLISGAVPGNALAADTFVVGAMGDSITRAFDAARPLDNPALSWSTGDDMFGRVASHKVKIQKIRGGKVSGFNSARSGGRSIEMPGQAAELNRYHPDYVTILIGANDLCDWGNEAAAELNKLEQNVRQSIEALVDANSSILIALSPVPDMFHLWEIGNESSCQRKWDMLNICPRLLSSKATAEDREHFSRQWEEVNNAYAGIAADFPQNVRFAVNGANIAFEPKHISSLDCFHPSIDGQNLLSDTVWEAVADDFGGQQSVKK